MCFAKVHIFCVLGKGWIEFLGVLVELDVLVNLEALVNLYILVNLGVLVDLDLERVVL